ncbi:MAG: glutamate--tRNA ligase, partial [Rickettsia endosymbiont of Ixodes persulcatus]|nr:glutamate--tRNA ligase [Rickettsia endosymbiont of Ixodes persulcatus]
LVNLANESLFYVEDIPISIDQESSTTIKDYKHIFSILYDELSKISEHEWNNGVLTSTIKNISQNLNIKISTIYHCLRASIIGRMNAPSIIGIMINFEQKECLQRIKYVQNIK